MKNNLITENNKSHAYSTWFIFWSNKSIIKHKLTMSRNNAHQIVQYKQRERAVCNCSRYRKPIEWHWWVYSEIIGEEKGITGGEVFPKTPGEDGAGGVKDEWYLITFVKMTHAATRPCVMTSLAGGTRTVRNTSRKGLKWIIQRR